MSAANCSFCSRSHEHIQVICESRCLMCERCLQSKSLKVLLVNSSLNNKLCPICGQLLAPNMISLITSFDKELKEKSTVTSYEFGDCANGWIVFMKKFRSLYGDIKGDGSDTSGDIFDSTNEVEASVDVNKNAQRKKVAAKSESIMNNLTYVQKLTLQGTLDICNEVIVAIWQDMFKDSLECIGLTALKVCARRKGNQKTMDMRNKLLYDMLRSPSCAEHPLTYLFSCVSGLLPKISDVVREQAGGVFVNLLILSFADICIEGKASINTAGTTAAYDYYINENELNLSSIRGKLKKQFYYRGKGFDSDIVMPLRKGICILDYLSLKMLSAIWMMLPMSSACVEYQCDIPWSISSILKLFELLFRVVNTFYGNVTHNTGGYDAIALKVMQWLPMATKEVWEMPTSELNSHVSVTANKHQKHLQEIFERFYRAAEGKYISAFAFTATCYFAWEAEFVSVRNILTRRTVANTRRNAMTGHYDPANSAVFSNGTGHGAKLTVNERSIIQKIVDFFQAQGAPGIDWEDLKTESGRAKLPFAVPPVLLKRSFVELNYYSNMLATNRDKNQFYHQLENIQDDCLTFPLTESMHLFPSLKSLTDVKISSEPKSISEAIHEVEQLARAEYLKSHTVGGVKFDILDRVDSCDIGDVLRTTGARNFSVSSPTAAAVAADAEPDNFHSDVSVVKLRLRQSISAAKLLRADENFDFEHGKLSSLMAKTNVHKDLFRDVPPNIGNLMDDKYFKESLVLKNSEPALSCYGGELIQGVRKDHFTPFLDDQDVYKRSAVSATFKKIVDPYDALYKGEHKVSMPDTLTLNTDVLVKTGLLIPESSSGEFNDYERFGLLDPDAENEDRVPFIDKVDPKYEKLILFKGNSSQSSTASNEFLDIILFPDNVAKRKDKSALTTHILEMLAQQNMKDLQAPILKPSPIKTSRDGRRIRSFSDDFMSPRSRLSMTNVLNDNKKDDMSEPKTEIDDYYSMDDEDPQELMREITLSGSAVPVRNPERMRSRLVKSMPFLPASETLAPIDTSNDFSKSAISLQVNSSNNDINSLLFSAPEPAGTLDRSVLNLSFINHLRDNEFPDLDEKYYAEGDQRNIVHSFILKDVTLDKKAFEKLILKYFRKPFLGEFKRIELFKTGINARSIELLCNAFKEHGCSNLILLNLAGNSINMTGFYSVITNGLLPGGCCDNLMKLNLQNTGLTLDTAVAIEKFQCLENLKNLRILDVSWNKLNCDTKAQRNALATIFAPLFNLEVISLAFNRIGDAGCRALIGCFLTKLKNLCLIDFSNCFISNKSHTLLTKYLGTSASPTRKSVTESRNSFSPTNAGTPVRSPMSFTSPTNVDSPSSGGGNEHLPFGANFKLKIFILQGSLINNDGITALRESASINGKKLVTEGIHKGIDIPVSYDMLPDSFDFSMTIAPGS